MVNLIWVAMTIIGFVFAMVNGTMDEVNKAVFDGGKQAVTICIGLVSVLVFWLGLMKIAEESGLLKLFSKLFQPFLSLLFPRIPKDHPAFGYILSNMVANLFGLGNAATPLGIKAMEQLKKLNKDSQEASDEMITFLTLNTSAITLIPTTVIGIRMAYNSNNPTEIVGVTILAQIVSFIGGLMINSYFARKRKRKGGK
ncbi:spore maturation protein [Bacillus sp. RG28]|uniref:Spore maturation protein n=1 Tax=Gottfriedia endophytica TaxID=2820819 RepID=A0A940NMQ0_9BACI|nr:nucleoside recognition domain-containing protein [Gottfriedia endophytica]MBP0724268.1 spore maturation protein [Gottfriedia endophytica]